MQYLKDIPNADTLSRKERDYILYKEYQNKKLKAGKSKNKRPADYGQKIIEEMSKTYGLHYTTLYGIIRSQQKLEVLRMKYENK